MKKIVIVLSLQLFVMAAFSQNKPSYIIYNAKGKKVSYDKMMSTLKTSGVVLFGELHNNPIAHWLEYEVTVELSSSRQLILGAEMIEADNQKILRFEDFETINGPDLHIYLSSDLEAKDYIDLGEIKATKGNVNYEVPSNVDLEKYNKVLVWCEPFRILFSYAELN